MSAFLSEWIIYYVVFWWFVFSNFRKNTKWKMKQSTMSLKVDVKKKSHIWQECTQARMFIFSFEINDSEAILMWNTYIYIYKYSNVYLKPKPKLNLYTPTSLTSHKCIFSVNFDSTQRTQVGAIRFFFCRMWKNVDLISSQLVPKCSTLLEICRYIFEFSLNVIRIYFIQFWHLFVER